MATTASDLPDEIIRHIASRVTGVLGLKRFGVVCPRWRIAAKAIAKRPPQFPMLLPSEDGKPMNRLAFSVADKKTYKFTLPGSCPITSNNEIISSPDGGWILTLSGYENLDLVNPLTSSSIDFPSLPLKKTPVENVRARGFLRAKIISSDLITVLIPDNEGLRVYRLDVG